jgi:hypothetical protein
MGRTSNILRARIHSRRILPVLVALLACLIWVSAAQAQDAPFNAQYDAPPTTPECDPGNGGSNGGAGDFDPGVSGSSEGSGEGSNSECEPQVLTSSEGSVEVLPTTGGLLAAPVLLGVAAILGAGVLIARRNR